jgi:hypothetical protein
MPCKTGCVICVVNGSVNRVSAPAFRKNLEGVYLRKAILKRIVSVVYRLGDFIIIHTFSLVGV